jgi:L-histidine N-alpha-methyltransferase
MKLIEPPNVISDQVGLGNLLTRQSETEVIRDIFNDLSADQKCISSRFFYNEKGSELFEVITTLKEYYLTRTEISILKEASPFLFNGSSEITIVELGSGDCSKISILLDAIPGEMISATKYLPVDISESAIIKSTEVLSKTFPGLQIQGVLADFMKQLDFIAGNSNKLICFFGSTIGNLTQDEALEFLSHLRDNMAPGDSLLIGLDMVKDVELLEAAYNDEQKVTEAFNKNILSAINEIAKTGFEPEQFRHIAFYNRRERRIEMHLEALAEMDINSPFFPSTIYIKEGETIHTENSHKFTSELIHRMVEKSGLKIKSIFTDRREWFSLIQLYAND